VGLFIINFVVVTRFICDEITWRKLNEQERALYQFFHCRCGVNRLQFDEILKQGQFLELDSDQEVPHVESTLYLVLEGVVECQTRFGGPEDGYDTFLKRSGQFFDIRLFNLFTLPVGFDANEFRAKTMTKTKFFGWTVKGLIAMRESYSPALLQFWEYMVLRTLADAAVRHHLRDTDAVYDAWLVPEDPDWLEGAQSRDFQRPAPPDHGWPVACRQFSKIFGSFVQVFPPKGIRHETPCMVLRRNPVQDCIEVMAKAKQEVVDKISDAASSNKDYQFLSQRLSNPTTDKENFLFKHVSNPTTTTSKSHAEELREPEVSPTPRRQTEEPGEAADRYLSGHQSPSDEES
jgi:hypothetical protein